MSSGTPVARNVAKSILRKAGLLPVARRIAQIFRAPSEYSGYERRFQQLKRQHAHVLGERLNNRHLRQRVALVCCWVRSWKWCASGPWPCACAGAWAPAAVCSMVVTMQLLRAGAGRGRRARSRGNRRALRSRRGSRQN